MESTPYYFYDYDLLNATLDLVQEETKGSNFHVYYAIKANNNKKIVKTIAEKKFGADCVSGAEIQFALEAGIPNSKIVFAGVGKTDEEIRFAIGMNIAAFNCESFEEIEVINEIAQEFGRTVNVALRLNPNVNAYTHEKITTGLNENKFGISPYEYEEIKNAHTSLTNVSFVGLHFHIGSQITEMKAFKNLCFRINALKDDFIATFGKLQYLNVGGGLGIDYNNPVENSIPDFKSYFRVFKDHLNIGMDVPVYFELGRSLVGQCGTLFTKVLYVKRSEQKQFAVLDAGMTELLRPAMYGAQHKIEKYNASSNELLAPYDVVGPICESSDSFGENVLLPKLKRGDLIAIRSCGAYAESMSLRYNGREAIPSYPSAVNATAFKVAKTA
ncbi:MAG: diaminopimelate decarboxylase [Crocinitomicaceae bacterium]|nr:diaminopimelate decarboxylase [Crocinitomicaceae bacterium]